MDSQDQIRARIKTRLKELKLGVKPAGVRSGLGETTVRNFLDGSTRSMTVETIAKLAPTLKASTNWLLFGETAEVVRIWDRIPIDRRGQALTVLETFVSRDDEPDAGDAHESLG